MAKEQKNFQIDIIDKKILSLLSKNARIPFLEIARECHVSGSAIHQRVQRLTRLGLISGTEYVYDTKKLGYETCAYVGIFLEKAGLFKTVVQELEKIPEIVECHYTTGNYSLYIKVYAKNNNHLREILADRIQNIAGISRTETFISLEEQFRRQLPLDNV
jgi:Lrp/AsnC family transcriptional regulator, regulator for asnA, asnC and gidA